jgi:hypothetical protein
VPFFSKYREVHCPDGPRLVLKDPKSAFSIVAPDWEARVNAVVKAFNDVEASADVQVAKKIRQLAQDLDSNYADLQSHYLAAYTEFAANPCPKESLDKLNKANEEIRQMEFKLREIETKTETLTKPAPTVTKVFKTYGPSPTAETTLSDIEELVEDFRP